MKFYLWSSASCVRYSYSLFDNYKKQKQIDPKNIYKVPVCCHHFNSCTRISFCFTKKSFDEHYQQCYRSTQYMQCMQAKDHIQKLSSSCYAFKLDPAIPYLHEPIPLQSNKSNTQYHRYSHQLTITIHFPLFKRT